ncbi:meiosis protein [Niveomyces insectorum RCEF 264]|uniref:Meiosis protein n=1 Tax=Niveomyces insectorum RCEF 264 TaxID=1081102 RepID=A0A162MFZ5_9HYPO|nr:meiosis protein [Niveomyces insectorum RCEF 264]
MSQLCEEAVQRSPAVSLPGGNAESASVGGTPNSRVSLLSPTAKSVRSASKIIQTPDRETFEKQTAELLSPIRGSGGGGYRTTGVPVDNDPFVTPSKTKVTGVQQLSATASSFRPVQESKTQENMGDTKVPKTEEVDVTGLFRAHEQVSRGLSTDLGLTRCLEISHVSQPGSNNLVEVYIGKLASLGFPFRGEKLIFTENARVYIRFTNIRDACLVHRNVELCGPGWVATFLTPSDFVQIVAPGEKFANVHEGQLDLLAVLLHNAPIGILEMEPLIYRVLQTEGDLFAFQNDVRSEEGALKAIIEYADINTAVHVAEKLNGHTIDGLHIRLELCLPPGMGRSAPARHGLTTPMPTPPRLAFNNGPTGPMAPMGMGMGMSTSTGMGPPGPINTMVPHGYGMTPFQPPHPGMNSGFLPPPPPRHQPTPPCNGMGGNPQVALVPMVVRNPFTPGAPLILEPYGPHGSPMTSMGSSPLIYPPRTPVSSLAHQGHESGPVHRSLGMPSRFPGRRGSSLRDRGANYNNGHHNQVDVNRIRNGVDVRTTVMLRNIPNKVDQRMLKAIVDESSWGKYDFMYLRIDFANDCNVGYAFINFADPLDIIDFAVARDNQPWNCFRSDKIAEISYATIQGRDCLVQKFRNSSVMLEPPHYRPKLYFTINCIQKELAGQEEPFPPPDNPSKMKRSCENAEHVGLFTPSLGQYYRDDHRRRNSQFDRGTRMAALEEIDYDSSMSHMYMPN